MNKIVSITGGPRTVGGNTCVRYGRRRRRTSHFAENNEPMRLGERPALLGFSGMA